MKTSKIKPPILLKTILDILFFLLILTYSGMILYLIFQTLTDLPLDLTINGNEIRELSPAIIFILTIKILISAIFIYIIFLLRKVLRSFFKRKLFTPLQISGLNLIGQLIIIFSLVEVMIDFFLSLTLNKARIGISVENSFDSIWFTLALGLFFILLSKSFSYAKSLQEENDLTV
ncbi:DUF2975 domain-containing protein [Gillisia limnaea]|uniref:Membrane protein n=1 Tax=Gillisia limnaea (strain DSM 15749 / LMG 21470 / R-8282) TaxID=865937 RepID=H2BSE8_GILLR|nr:DUF2975 domain-containing protein [Gillisia limnaea]EHQ02495.1 membrane protein [Gillisia limnaea DSM 15749]